MYSNIIDEKEKIYLDSLINAVKNQEIVRCLDDGVKESYIIIKESYIRKHLKRKYGIHRVTAGKFIERLEEGGIVTRIKCGSDKRTKLVKLIKEELQKLNPIFGMIFGGK